MAEIKKKDNSFTSEDLNIESDVNIKLKTVDITNPKVIEIKFMYYAIPRKTLEINDYECIISRLKRKFNRVCSEFAEEMSSNFRKEYINDFNFTSANLKKGYNKFVTMSIFLRQINDLTFEEIEHIVKSKLGYYSSKFMTNVIDSGFDCKKKK